MRGLAIILGFYWIGEAAMRLLGFAFPGSLVGMLLLTFALNVGWIKESWIAGTSGFITSVMPLFFVPAAAAFLEHLHLFAEEGLSVVTASAISTLVVFGSVGWLAQKLEPQEKSPSS